MSNSDHVFSRTSFVGFTCMAIGFLLLAWLCAPAPVNGANALPKDPFVEFPVDEISIETASGTFRFSVEIADDDAERSKGLMLRRKMLPTHGMLFDFRQVAPVAMWMKNTYLPLDMIFVRPDGTVARIARKTEPLSTEIISSYVPVSHVLELNAGMAAQIGLKKGDVIRHSSFAISD